MDFELNEEQQQVKQSIREFAEAELRPHVMEWDESQKFPKEVFQEMGKLGLMGILVPEEYGGAGMDTIAYVLAMEEISKAMLAAGPGGLIASVLFFFYRGKATELDAARSKIDALQAQIVSMLQAQLESEPERRETLSRLTRLVEDQSVVLKGLLK